ncbi:MAG: class I SAM-dependent methyltransferase [Candidatus Sulfotelmatobacter sp.]
MPETSITKVEYEYESSAASCAHAYLLAPVKRLAQSLGKKGPVLDLGCGNGSLSHELSKLGFEVHGVDRSESGIQIAREAFPQVQFSLGDVEKVLSPDPFQAESFDVVVSTEVVEHLYHPRRLIQNAFRLLKPSGHFIISTPYHGYVKNVVLALSGKMDNHFTALWDGGHIKFWSRKTLSGLLMEKGFTDVRFVGTGRVPYIWKSMILIARKPTGGWKRK